MASFRSYIVFMVFLITFARAQSATGQFTLTVYQPASPLNDQVVNAAGLAFYVGGEPATYCPLTDPTLCPVGNQTIFAGMSDLFVEVPGGQQVYTTTAGALSFTEAHSTSEPGVFYGQFTNVTVSSDCAAPISVISWQSPETNGVITSGILACPEVSSSQNGSTTYQIYVNTPAFNQTNCTTLEGLLPHYTSAGVYGAWEYI